MQITPRNRNICYILFSDVKHVGSGRLGRVSEKMAGLIKGQILKHLSKDCNTLIGEQSRVVLSMKLKGAIKIHTSEKIKVGK